jgi:hypothetical protein
MFGRRNTGSNGDGSGGKDKLMDRMRRNIAKANDGRPAGERGSMAQTAVVGGTDPEAHYEAARHIEAPVNEFMGRLIAQELPILDSTSRSIVNAALREHKEAGKPQITCVGELPEEIREIMGL